MIVSLIERAAFEMIMRSPWFFKNIARRDLYRSYKDSDHVNEAVLRLLNEYEPIFKRYSYRFDFPELKVNIKDKTIKPFGTAAGMDKNADALIPLSCMYGFLEPGTIVINRRPGNHLPRIAVDPKHENVYNAQGFPSKGSDYVFHKILEYRKRKNQTPIYSNVCGVPATDEKTDKALGIALEEMELLLDKFNNHVDGFVWNPFSPNTETLESLRKPDVFNKYAKLVEKYVPEKLKLVKMGPYEESDKKEWMKLVSAWLDGGGDGIVAVNTYKVQKNKVPSRAWGYPTAGISGSYLKNYRLRAVKDTRHEFPDAIIFATGGIFDGDDAYETLKYADALESYTPVIFYGPAVERKKMQRVVENLRRNGYNNLEEMQQDMRSKRNPFSKK